MSTLTLNVLRSPESASTQRRRLQGGSLTLGRAEDCEWSLPDPLRSLSRRHCTVEFYGGVWQVRDLSANGTRINAESDPVGNGLTRQLRDGDRLLLGDYEIEVRIEESMPTISGPFNSPFGGPDVATSVFGPSSQRGGFGNVRLPGLDDPLPYRPFESAPPDAGVQSDHLPSSASAYVPPPLMPARSGKAIPDNWFDLEESQIRLRSPAANPAPEAHSPARPPTPLDPAPQRGAARAAEPVESRMPQAPTEASPFAAEPAHEAQVLMPLGEPDGVSPSPYAAAPAARLPAAPPPKVPAAPAAGHEARSDAAGDAMRAALALFFEGGDLPEDLVVRAAANPEEALRNAGALLRATVAGMRSLLISRGSVKREFRIEQTMIRTRENNPLKFSTSDEQALAALLDPRTAALPAVNEAIKDLTGHQVAVLAATQAAARALLKELEPAQLLAEDTGGGFFPGAQEKRLWEAYKRRHAQLIEQFEDDLKSAFGTAFARAYESAVGNEKT